MSFTSLCLEIYMKESWKSWIVEMISSWKLQLTKARNYYLA